MARLTDTQLIILSAASQRDDRGVELPANAKGEAAGRVVDKLIRAGLLEEVGASGSLPVWRRDDSGGAMALRITKTGLAAIDAADEARPLPRRQAFVLLPPAKSQHLPPKPSPPASGFPLRHGSPPVRGMAPVRRRPRLARDATAGRARNKLGCSRCWADQRERRLLPSCARPIGSSIRYVASSPVWCARSSASISARRRSTVTGSIASSSVAALVPVPADRAVAQSECHAARADRSGGAGRRGPQP